MASRSDYDDDMIDVENATVIEGAGVDLQGGLSTDSSPLSVAQDPHPNVGSWVPSGPMGIPQTPASVHHSSLGGPSSGASSLFSPSSVSRYAPNTYEPSVVSTSYRSASSVGVHTPGAAPPWPTSSSRAGSFVSGGFAGTPNGPRSFETSSSATAIPTQGSSAYSVGNSSYGGQSGQPQSWMMRTMSTNERRGYSSYQAWPAVRRGSQSSTVPPVASTGIISSTAQPFGQPSAGSTIGDEPTYTPATRRSLLSSMLAQHSSGGRRRPSELSPYTRPSSRTGTRRGSAVKGFSDQGDDYSVTGSPQNSNDWPGEQEPQGSNAPIFVPSRSLTTTDVSRTMVSTRTRAETDQETAERMRHNSQSRMSSRSRFDDDKALASSVGTGLSPRAMLPSSPVAATPPPNSMVETPLPRAPSSSPPASIPRFLTPPPPELPVPGRTTIYSHIPEHEQVYLDIAEHPVDDLLNMMSFVLQRVLEKNDTLYSNESRGAPLRTPEVTSDSGYTLQNTLLSFHSSNIPAISLQAYLSRILKYCPTTNEVFISLLVYFDRITRTADSLIANQPESDGIEPIDGELGTSTSLFVLDSYNIHRLIIAGITVASKFFSDIFYKNSRYAKVGGLPGEELNHLELQFLVLVDFKLMVSVEELQMYANYLATVYYRENKGK